MNTLREEGGVGVYTAGPKRIDEQFVRGYLPAKVKLSELNPPQVG